MIISCDYLNLSLADGIRWSRHNTNPAYRV